jgi:hypothetical protein
MACPARIGVDRIRSRLEPSKGVGFVGGSMARWQWYGGHGESAQTYRAHLQQPSDTATDLARWQRGKEHAYAESDSKHNRKRWQCPYSV